MSLIELWQKQQLEIEKKQEASKPFKEKLKKLGEEKEVLLVKEQELNEKKRKLLQLRQSAKKTEDHLADLESKRYKITKELYGGNITNPKELSSLEDKGRSLDNQINKLLELYLELEEKGAVAEKNIKGEEELLAAAKSDYNQKARLLKKDWEASKTKIEALDNQIRQVEDKISPLLLAKYKRLQVRLGANTLVEVRKGICVGCGIKLSSLLYQQLRLGELVQCENCGRLLIIPGENPES
ncbi:MAG: C4-type zinc ribbon domain-containing protein [Bacillota bacterium]